VDYYFIFLLITSEQFENLKKIHQTLTTPYQFGVSATYWSKIITKQLCHITSVFMCSKPFCLKPSPYVFTYFAVGLRLAALIFSSSFCLCGGTWPLNCFYILKNI